MKRAISLLLFAVVGACSSSEPAASGSPSADAPLEDAGAPVDAGGDALADGGASEAGDAGALTGACASTFGDALTAGFGRIDGVVYAVQKPSDTHCTLPNDDHLVLQVLMNGAVYRMVVNVQSDRQGQDPRVRLATVSHALPEPAFAEGWHTGVALDYATTLHTHAPSFTPYVMDELVAKVAAELKVGDPVSVYATSGSGRPESAHLVHRNRANADGAIVVGAAGPTPKFLLFAFANQTF